RWSAWRKSDDDDRVERGWHLGGLDWTGAATAVRFRTSGHVSRLRAYYVQSPVEPASPRRLQIAGSPLIISRFSWQADESIRRAARSRARRSAVDAHVALRRQSALREWHPRLPACNLGSPRHRLHRLSRRRALRDASRHREGRRDARRPEDLRARGGEERRGP